MPAIVLFPLAVVREGIQSFFGFPVWWYTRGVILVAERLKQFWIFSVRMTGVSVWMRNLFVPMFGDVSIAGRIISFLLRLIMVMWKIFLLGLWALCLIALFLFYLILPFSCLLGLFYHLSGIFSV